jgi:hypothetical protein
MQNRVILRKLNIKRDARRSSIVGYLRSFPMKGRKIIVDLEDDSEYVTTPIVRMLQIVSDGTLYIETSNTRYSLRIKR